MSLHLTDGLALGYMQITCNGSIRREWRVAPLVHANPKVSLRFSSFDCTLLVGSWFDWPLKLPLWTWACSCMCRFYVCASALWTQTLPNEYFGLVGAPLLSSRAPSTTWAVWAWQFGKLKFYLHWFCPCLNLFFYCRLSTPIDSVSHCCHW